MIEQAYRQGEKWSVPIWCQDEAGPYQAIPHPGRSWQLEGQPARRPHEYFRGGTAKLLTLFHPATGELRAQPALRTTNAILHPWLKAELTAILGRLPSPETLDPFAPGRQWSEWGWNEESLRSLLKGCELPPELPIVRIGLVWDNLAGHYTPEIVSWCIEQGVVPIYTPLGGSWLNLAESVQRIVVRRALDGQHPPTDEELLDRLSATVRGWNRAPTPFEWGGKRAERRQRARERRHALGGSGGFTRTPMARRRRSSLLETLLPSSLALDHPPSLLTSAFVN